MTNDLSWQCAFRDMFLLCPTQAIQMCSICVCVYIEGGWLWDNGRGSEVEEQGGIKNPHNMNSTGMGNFSVIIMGFSGHCRFCVRYLVCSISTANLTYHLYECFCGKFQDSFGLGQTKVDMESFFPPQILPTQGITREKTSTSLSAME